MFDTDTEYEKEQLLLEAVWRKRYHNRYMSAPHCDDPDHPGCELCCEDEEN